MQYYYQNSSTSSNRNMNFGLSRHQSASNSYAQDDNILTTQRNFLNHQNQNADISQNQLHTTNNNIYQNLRNNANNLSISQAYQTDRFGRDVFGQYIRRSGRKNDDNSNDEEDYSDEENRNQQANTRQQRSRNRVNQQDSIHSQLHQQQLQLFQDSPSQQQKLSRNQLANIFNNNDLHYNVADLINKNEQEKDEAMQKLEEENLEKIQNSPYYIDANLIMKSTCFNQISFQIFFLLYLSNILWNFNGLYNFIFLWFVDIVQFIMTYKRISLNKLFLETYQSQKQKISYGLLEYLEIIYFIVFKIILFIRLYFIKFDFFYIPLVFLIYVSTRATYIMRKKAKQNQSILTDIFIWTFKIFLAIQIVLISLKFENQINWKWRDVFWAYWVFFSIMVGINIGFIIILFSKCYSKCSEDGVEVYELKGLFWLFILSNSLTVNITIYITSLISYYDDGDKQGVYFGFQYGFAFTIFLTIYSLLSRQSIYLFLFKITKDDDLSQENLNLQNEINQNCHNQSNSRQQQQDMSQNSRRRNQNNQNQDEEQDQEIEESQNESSNRSQRQQNNINENMANSQNTKQQKKIKIVSKELNTGFPLILQKLSSTYFKIFKAVSQGSKNKISKQNDQKKKPQPSKEEIQKNIIVNCKSHSFVSPREALSLNNFNFKDLNQELRLQLSTKRSKVLQSKIELSTRSVAKSILLPLQDPQLKKMAQDTDQKYQNFLQSEKGVEIQKRIYEQNLNQEVNDNLKNINFSLEEIPKQHFNIEGPGSDSQIPKDQQGEQSNLESNNQDITIKSHNNNKNDNQSNCQSQQSSNVIHDEINKSNNITKTGKNIKQYTCEQENLQVTKQENSIGNTCVVCFDKTPDTLYMPCGHGGLCYECAIDILKKTGECYLCRVEITEVYQLDIKQKKGKNYKVLVITQVLQDASNLNQSQNENRNTNQIPFEQVTQLLQERLQQAPQQNELMSASFHLARQINSPINNNTANSIFVFGNEQPQIAQPMQIEQIQLQNNGNFQISDKYLAEDIEKSFQDQYKLPNTLNIHQNYFLQNEEIQQESTQNNVILDQLNVQFRLISTQKNLQSPLDLKDNASNYLIKFDSIEETNIQKDQHENQQNEHLEIISSNESPQLKNNSFALNEQNNSALLNQIKIQQGQFLISQNKSNENMQIQEDETNTTEKSVQNIQNKENFIKNSTKNNTLAEAPLNQIQKSSQEEEIQLPTENS
ncbi:hypothetical protein ABPG72_011476 [Tetrahymena utriculariae]